MVKSIQSQIEEKIRAGIEVMHLDVINESSKHNVPAGSETHFKLIIVSRAFEGCSLIDRHRQINTLLTQELSEGVHALSLNTLTPLEWHKKGGTVKETPPCLGGSQS